VDGFTWGGFTQQSALKLLLPKFKDGELGARPRVEDWMNKLAPATLPTMAIGLPALPIFE